MPKKAKEPNKNLDRKTRFAKTMHRVPHELMQNFGFIFDKIRELERTYNSLTEEDKKILGNNVGFGTKYPDRHWEINRLNSEIGNKIMRLYDELRDIYTQIGRIHSITSLRILLLTILRESSFRWLDRIKTEIVLPALTNIARNIEFYHTHRLIIKTLVKEMQNQDLPYERVNALDNPIFNHYAILAISEIATLNPENIRLIINLSELEQSKRTKKDLIKILGNTKSDIALQYLQSEYAKGDISLQKVLLIAIGKINPELGLEYCDECGKNKKTRTIAISTIVEIIIAHLGNNTIFQKGLAALIKTESYLIGLLRKRNFQELAHALVKRIMWDDTGDDKLIFLKDNNLRIATENAIHTFVDKLNKLPQRLL